MSTPPNSSRFLAPLIGITTYAKNQDQIITLPAFYVESVRRAGGIPVLIPPGESQLDRLLNQLDGLILAGGGDLDPALYGGIHHPTIYSIDSVRDASELEMVRRVIDDELPTFAICRGMQVVNVALGGTLYEHLPDSFGDQVPHRLPPREPVLHSVQATPSSRLGELWEKPEVEIMSWHHQGVCQLGRGLQVAATAPDGVVEAMELPGHPWLVAVQWHPELTAESDPLQQRLFDRLVEMASQTRPTAIR